MISVTLQFNTIDELLTFLGKPHAPVEVSGALTGPGAPAPAPAPEPMKATPSARAAKPKAETAKPEPAKAEPVAADTTPTPEQVSAAIIKFLPNAEAKAAAAAVLADFGVQRGKDLKPEQRAPFLAALAEAGAAFGI